MPHSTIELSVAFALSMAEVQLQSDQTLRVQQAIRDWTTIAIHATAGAMVEVLLDGGIDQQYADSPAGMLIKAFTHPTFERLCATARLACDIDCLHSPNDSTIFEYERRFRDSIQTWTQSLPGLQEILSNIVDRPMTSFDLRYLCGLLRVAGNAESVHHLDLDSPLLDRLSDMRNVLWLVDNICAAQGITTMAEDFIARIYDGEW